VKVMAKDLVRTRQYVKKFMMMRANIQAVSLKIQTLKSQVADDGRALTISNVAGLDGASDEGRHQGDALDERAAQPAANSEDHAGV